MQQRALELLEFNKILKCLSSYTVSEPGLGLALALKPSDNLETIQSENSLFEETRTWLALSGFCLYNFPSLEPVFKVLERQNSYLDIELLWALRQVLSQSAQALELLKDAKTGEDNRLYPLLSKLAFGFERPHKIMQALARCLSDDGLLKDESSPALALVRGELRRLHQQCTRKVKEFANTYNMAQYLQDDFMTLSSDRYVLPLKSNFKGRVQGIIHDYSQTGETCYFEPYFLVEINNRLQELKKEEREEERKVLIYLSSLARDEEQGVRSQFALLVRLDLLQAKAAMASALNGRSLEISNDAPMMLLGARHPLLAMGVGVVSEQATNRKLQHLNKNAQPVDIELLKGQKILVVSGGNAGGKTVCLKTLGLIALMGHASLPVPVQGGSSLPLFTRIHAFIGDEQSLEDSVSTFTAQIEHLAAIWSTLDSQSLIILDEFGSGTDPSQGAALAQAVLDGLLECSAYAVAATHFPALKAYALGHEKVRAASVLFDPSTKKPLFRIAYDQVGSSQALDVARQHGLPESVLKKAEQYLLIDGEDSSLLIERLNSLAVAKEHELDDLKIEKIKFAERRAKLEERFNREKDEVFKALQKEAQEILRQWRDGKIAHKQALKELAKTRTTLNSSHTALGSSGQSVDSKTLTPEDLKIGQQVFYSPWGKKGELLELDARRSKARLDMSGVRMWVDLNQLAESAPVAPAVVGKSANKSRALATADNLQNKKSEASSTSYNATTNLSLTLDLRGKRADVAVSELAQFIDSAIISGREELELIHGRGTGVLRREVHLFLKTFPAVKSFRLAPEDQGGDGKTIVDLR